MLQMPQAVDCPSKLYRDWFRLGISNSTQRHFHLWDLVRQYITEQLKPTYWALLVDSQVNNKPGLLARECSEGNKLSFSLRTEEGHYTEIALSPNRVSFVITVIVDKMNNQTLSVRLEDGKGG